MPSAKQVLSFVLVATLVIGGLFLPTAQSEGENATITGDVTDADTGLPLEDINVTARLQGGDFENTTATNAVGYYSMDVMDGTYSLSVFEYPTYYLFERYGVQVGENQTATQDIDLIPHGGENSGFEGVVTDAVTGDPLSGVMAWFSDPDNETAWVGWSNETGDLNETLVPGNYSISFSLDGFRTLMLPPVLLEDGDFPYLEVELWPENSTLWGYVTDNVTGDPIFNTTVVVSQGEGYDGPAYYQNQTVTNASGWFGFNLSAGVYDLSFFGPRGYYSNLMFGGQPTWATTVAVGVGEDVRQDAALDPSNFRGNLTDGAGDPLGFPPVLVMALNLEGLFKADNQTADQDEDEGPGGPIAIPYSDGFYEFRLTPGNWWVVALDMTLFDDPDNATYDANLTRVTVDEAGTLAYHDFTLWDLNSTVTGLITDPDGAPLENATVQLYSRYTVLFDESKTVQTDEAGSYSLEAGQGDYFVIVSYHPGVDEPDPFEASIYQPVVEPISLGSDDLLTSSHQLAKSLPTTQYQNATIASDWNTIEATMEMAMGLNQSMRFRLWLDGLIGDGDYYLSQEELDLFSQMMANTSNNDEDSDPLLVDGVEYLEQAGLNLTLVNGVGAWNSSTPLGFSGAVTMEASESMDRRWSHMVEFNVTYATDAANIIYNFTFPETYNLTDNITLDYVNFTGPNPVTITTGLDPDPEDNQTKEQIWFNMEAPNNPPTAILDDISPNPAQEGDLVTFQGSGQDEDGDVIGYEWQIDNQTASMDPVFTNDTLAAGNHSIRLRVQDDYGDWSEWATTTLQINEIPNIPPKATIEMVGPNPAPEGEDVNFQGSGQDDDGTVIAHEWYIDGGLESTQLSFIKNNIAVGVHNVEFRVQDDDGVWSDFENVTLEVLEQNDPPRAIIDSLNPNPAYPGQTITFTGSGLDSDGQIVAYEWTIDDWVASTEASFTLNNLTEGLHTLELRVMDDNDTWSEPDEDTVEIRGNEAPLATIVNVNPNPATTLEAITLNGSGSDSDGSVVAYQWQLDGTPIASTADHLLDPQAAGSYTVGFRVKDDNNTWSALVTRALYVNPTNHPPTAYIDSITPDNVTPDTNIIFIGYGSDSDGSIAHYQWFIDGDPLADSDDREINRRFSETELGGGDHTVGLKVQDNGSLWSQMATATLHVEVDEPLPVPLKARFSLSSTRVKVLESVTIDATTSTGDILEYYYDFGDGSTRGPGDYDISHHPYSNPGVYTITVTVYDAAGNNDSATDVVTVYEEDTGDDDDGPLPGFELAGLLAALGVVAWVRSRRRS